MIVWLSILAVVGIAILIVAQFTAKRPVVRLKLLCQ